MAALRRRADDGCELTEVAVRGLRSRQPDFNFFQLDLSEPLPSDLIARYVLISAFDVLFHIVDDLKWQTAIANIADMLKPGGIFIFTDVFFNQSELRSQHFMGHNINVIRKVYGQPDWKNWLSVRCR